MTETKILSCKCGETFEQDKLLNRHKDLKHISKVIIEVPVKLQGVTNTNELIFTRHINGNFHCMVCQSSIQSASEFKNHLLNQCMIEKDEYQCPSCTSCFKTPNKLQRHLFKDHSLDTLQLTGEIGVKEKIVIAKKNNEKYECPFCPEEYHALETLNRHVQGKCSVLKEHVHGSSLQCEKCNELFDNRQKLAHHTYNNHLEITKVNTRNGIVQIHRDTNGIVKCPMCNIFSSPTMQTLFSHIQYKCTSIKSEEFSCDDCASKYELKSALFKHRYNVHSPSVILKYQSSSSGKRINITKDRTDANELNCPNCAIGYTVVDHLIDHISDKCSIIRDSNNTIYKFTSSCVLREKAIELTVENYIMIDDD